jgi:fluoride exporter
MNSEHDLSGRQVLQAFSQILFVALGSALGGLARWAVSVWMFRWLGTAFPWGTLFINISGSLFLGWFMTLLTDRLAPGQVGWIRADDLRLLVAVGFTGAYTTFSTLEYETSALLGENENLKAFGYMLLSVVLGLVAVRSGIALARWR